MGCRIGGAESGEDSVVAPDRASADQFGRQIVGAVGVRVQNLLPRVRAPASAVSISD